MIFFENVGTYEIWMKFVFKEFSNYEWSSLIFVGHIEYPEFWGYFRGSAWCTDKKKPNQVTGNHVI